MPGDLAPPFGGNGFLCTVRDLKLSRFHWQPFCTSVFCRLEEMQTWDLRVLIWATLWCACCSLREHFFSSFPFLSAFIGLRLWTWLALWVRDSEILILIRGDDFDRFKVSVIQQSIWSHWGNRTKKKNVNLKKKAAKGVG